MEIKRAGSQPSGKGPAEWFTGSVRVDRLNEPPDPARVSMALVTFEPGARTAWHTHPLGQTLIVTAGCGRISSTGPPSRRTHDGDEPHRDSGKAERLSRGVAGARQRRAIRRLT
jgi:quercetin dioxygenase-like cupin family protein